MRQGGLNLKEEEVKEDVMVKINLFCLRDHHGDGGYDEDTREIRGKGYEMYVQVTYTGGSESQFRKMTRRRRRRS